LAVGAEVEGVAFIKAF